MFHVADATKLCGVFDAESAWSSSGLELSSGISQWFRRSSASEKVYDSETRSGLVRCCALNRTPSYQVRPSLVSSSMRRNPLGAGVIGRVASACAVVRTTLPPAALITSFEIGRSEEHTSELQSPEQPVCRLV